MRLSGFDKVMIWVVVIVVLHGCFSVIANADTEIIGNGLTYHFWDGGAAKKYSNKVSPDGRLIANPMIGIAVTDHNGFLFRSMTAFSGENSVGGKMFGGMLTEGIEVQNLQVGMALGVYEQQAKDFTDRNINAFRLVNLYGTDVIPLGGIAVNYKFPLGNNWFLKSNNLISPILANTSLSFGYEY